MRTVTVSCPGCAHEFRTVTIDEAERILFHGCTPCRESGAREPFRFQGARTQRGQGAGRHPVNGPRSSAKMN